jgi:hypothetical protein
LGKDSTKLTSSIHRWYGPFNSDAFTVKVAWELPKDVTARQVEEIWAYYVQGFLQGGEGDRQFYARPYTLNCTLIPHYREFSVTLFKSHLWVCTRRPIDGSTPQQRADTLAYITSRLRENSKPHIFGLYSVMDGEPVIVAFGLDVTLCYWRKNEGFLEPCMHFGDYSKEEARLEMETKVLTPLVKGRSRDIAAAKELHDGALSQHNDADD